MTRKRVKASEGERRHIYYILRFARPYLGLDAFKHHLVYLPGLVEVCGSAPVGAVLFDVRAVLFEHF